MSNESQPSIFRKEPQSESVNLCGLSEEQKRALKRSLQAELRERLLSIINDMDNGHFVNAAVVGVNFDKDANGDSQGVVFGHGSTAMAVTMLDYLVAQYVGQVVNGKVPHEAVGALPERMNALLTAGRLTPDDVIRLSTKAIRFMLEHPEDFAFDGVDDGGARNAA